MIHIVLFRPEKPLNTGNIMRTAVAINAHLHIIGPISFSLEDKDLKRAGLDYIERLHMSQYSDVESFFKEHPEDNIYYVTRYGDKPYSGFDFTNLNKDYYLMFGRESTGIPHEILLKHQDKLLRIPMAPNTRSLNLSNSVAIVVYEVLRQQGYPELATSEVIKGEDFLKKEGKK